MCEPVSATAAAGAAASSAAAAGTAAAASAATATAAAGTAAASASWLSYASLAATIVGGGLSAFGVMQQGEAAEKSAQYSAAVARNNRIVAERNAEDAEKRGAIAEAQTRKRTALIIGAQRAALAGQGTTIDENSGLDIQLDTYGAGELDALTIRNNSKREAHAYRVQGGNFEADASLSEARGGFASTAGAIGAGASLLGTASSVSDKWLTFKRPSTAYRV